MTFRTENNQVIWIINKFYSARYFVMNMKIPVWKFKLFITKFTGKILSFFNIIIRNIFKSDFYSFLTTFITTINLIFNVRKIFSFTNFANFLRKHLLNSTIIVRNAIGTRSQSSRIRYCTKHSTFSTSNIHNINITRYK